MRPSFLVIGAARAGTTFLWSMLRQHPDVYVHPDKELHVFCGAPCGIRDPGSYESLLREARPGQLAGDFTPNYLFYPWVAPLARASLGDIPSVALLRDPVDRAFSHYWLERRQGREWRSFESALRVEDTRVRSRRTGIRNNSYVARGMYADQIKRWYEHFSEESLLLVLAEDLYRDPLQVYRSVCTHIGVDPAAEPDLGEAQRNETSRPRLDALDRAFSAGRALAEGRRGGSMIGGWQRRLRSSVPAEMKPRTQTALAERYAKPNEELRRLTALELNGWNRA